MVFHYHHCSTLFIVIVIIYRYHFASWFWWGLLLITHLPNFGGVTTAHFLGGDRIIVRFHSIFITVQVSCHFRLAMTDFDRSPSSFGGGHNRSLSWWGLRWFLARGTVCAVFWVNLDYLPSHNRRSWVDHFICTPTPAKVRISDEDCTWSLTPEDVPISGEDCTWLLIQCPSRTTHGLSRPLVF